MRARQRGMSLGRPTAPRSATTRGRRSGSMKVTPSDWSLVKSRAEPLARRRGKMRARQRGMSLGRPKGRSLAMRRAGSSVSRSARRTVRSLVTTRAGSSARKTELTSEPIGQRGSQV